MMISYSQNHEDVLLNRAFRNVDNGFYVDIGAGDPEYLSVTKAFYDRGWSGINVEPTTVFNKLASSRERDVNLQMAVGTAPGWTAFHELDEYPECSGSSIASPLAGALKTSYRVPQRPLSEILDRHTNGRVIHFLKIDVEGSELDVIKSADWDRYRPVVLVVEATHPVSEDPSHEVWEPLIISHGYEHTWFDGINRWYVRNESPEIKGVFSRPVNTFDQFIPHKGATLHDATTAETESAEKIAELQFHLARLEHLVSERTLVIEKLTQQTEKAQGRVERPHGSRLMTQFNAWFRRDKPAGTPLPPRPKRAGKLDFTLILQGELDAIPELLKIPVLDRQTVRDTVASLRKLAACARARQLAGGFPFERELESLTEGLARLVK